MITEAPASFRIMSISRLPPRTFMPFASSGCSSALVRDAVPPACQIHDSSTTPLSSTTFWNCLPTAAFFHCRATS